MINVLQDELLDLTLLNPNSLFKEGFIFNAEQTELFEDHHGLAKNQIKGE